MKVKLSKDAYLCHLTPYLIVGNIKTNELRKQIMLNQACNTFKLISPNSQYDKFYIVSPSAKSVGKMQATFFYNNIPYSDIIRDTLEQIINEMSDMDYTTIKEAI